MTRSRLPLALGFLLAALPASADEVEDFYRGRTLTVMVGVGAGGEYDLQMRMVSRHIAKHIPGKPATVAQNMVGATGLLMANHLANVAPKDGSVMGLVQNGLPSYQAMGIEGVNFDATKFNWIGRIISNSAVLFAWHTAPAQTIDDVFTHELIVSTSGSASKLNWTVLNNVVHTKFKIINGYQGTGDSRLAMERGEVHALSMPWSLLKIEGAELLREKKINLLLQTGADKHPELPTVPRMIDLAKNDQDRQLLALFSSPSTVGRSVVAPPGLPPERVAELRKAFMDTIKDPTLIADIKKAQLELDPLSGEELQAAIAGSGDFSPALIERARQVAEMKN